MIYDLEDRTKKFSKEIVCFLRSVNLGSYNQNIISQLIRSATSVGANYHEANGAISTRDFFNKIAICRKEARETEYWIRLLKETNYLTEKQSQSILTDCEELLKIIGSIKKTIFNS